MNGGFGGGGGSSDGVEGVAGDGPVGAALSVDRGGRGAKEDAVGDGALIGAWPDGDGVGWGIAEGKVGQRNLAGCEVEDRAGREVRRVEDDGAARGCSQGEVVDGEVG